MKEKIQNLIKNIALKQMRAHIMLTGTIFAVIVTGVSGFYFTTKSEGTKITEDPTNQKLSETDSIIAVVGSEDFSIIGNTKSNNSWPGEIISLSNLQVQPDREGTIARWYVRIGERVNEGQVLGRLSRPPQTPEMISMLSEKSQMLSEARSNVEALRTYTTKRILQLKQLRQDTETSNQQKIDILKSDTSGGSDSQLSLIASKKRMTQAILRGSITKTFPVISNQTNTLSLESNNYNSQFNYGFGILNANLRNNFAAILFRTWTDLKDVNIVPEK